jgi:hypothetical protein
MKNRDIKNRAPEEVIEIRRDRNRRKRYAQGRLSLYKLLGKIKRVVNE